MTKNIKQMITINDKNEYIKLKYILFPYLIPKCDINVQISIWKEILSYIRNTKRFNKLYQINMKEI